MKHSSALPSSAAASQAADAGKSPETPRSARLGGLQRGFVIAALASAAAGFACVLGVVVAELSGHHAAPWLVWPFMALLPAAMVFLAAAVITGIVLRRHN